MTRELKQDIDYNTGTSAVPLKRNYERFTATLLLTAGIVYLALWLISVFSETSSLVTLENGKISMKMTELLGHIRTLTTIGFSIIGGFLIFKGKRTGWILGITVILLLLTICSGAVYQAFKLGESLLLIIAGAAWTLFLAALLILLLPSVRRKLQINASAMGTAAVLSAALVVFYFFVQ